MVYLYILYAFGNEEIKAKYYGILSFHQVFDNIMPFWLKELSSSPDQLEALKDYFKYSMITNLCANEHVCVCVCVCLSVCLSVCLCVVCDYTGNCLRPVRMRERGREIFVLSKLQLLMTKIHRKQKKLCVGCK